MLGGLSLRDCPRVTLAHITVARFISILSSIFLRDQSNNPAWYSALDNPSAANAAELCAIFFLVSQTLRLFQQKRRIAMSPLATALMNSRIEHSMSRFRAAECAGV